MTGIKVSSALGVVLTGIACLPGGEREGRPINIATGEGTGTFRPPATATADVISTFATPAIPGDPTLRPLDLKLVPDYSNAQQVNVEKAKQTLAILSNSEYFKTQKGRLAVEFVGSSGAVAVVGRVTYINTEGNELITPLALDRIFVDNPVLKQAINDGIRNPSSKGGVMFEMVGDKIVYSKITFTRQPTSMADLKDTSLYTRQILAVVDIKTGKPVKLSNASDISPAGSGIAMALPETGGFIGPEINVEPVRIFERRTTEEAFWLVNSDPSLGMKEIRDFALPANMSWADLQDKPDIVRNLVSSQNQASALIKSELVGKQKLDSSKLSVVSFAEKENSNKVVSIVKSTTDTQTAWRLSADGKTLVKVSLPPNAALSYDFAKNAMTSDFKGQQIIYDQKTESWQNTEGKVVWPEPLRVVMPITGERVYNLSFLDEKTSRDNVDNFFLNHGSTDTLGNNETALFIPPSLINLEENINGQKRFGSEFLQRGIVTTLVTERVYSEDPLGTSPSVRLLVRDAKTKTKVGYVAVSMDYPLAVLVQTTENIKGTTKNAPIIVRSSQKLGDVMTKDQVKALLTRPGVIWSIMFSDPNNIEKMFKGELLGTNGFALIIWALPEK